MNEQHLVHCALYPLAKDALQIPVVLLLLQCLNHQTFIVIFRPNFPVFRLKITGVFIIHSQDRHLYIVK